MLQHRILRRDLRGTFPMALDFTVVINVRQRFGDSQSEERGLEEDAPFVGASKDFEFSCPNVDSGAGGILLFQSQGVSHNKNILEVNGIPVFGGIPAASIEITPVSIMAVWSGNVMLVSPGVLRASNILHI